MYIMYVFGEYGSMFNVWLCVLDIVFPVSKNFHTILLSLRNYFENVFQLR